MQINNTDLPPCLLAIEHHDQWILITETDKYALADQLQIDAISN